MNAELHVNNIEQRMSEAHHVLANKNNKPPRRSLAALVVLGLVALALVTVPRPTLYYANVVVDAAGGVQLDFLLSGRQGSAACEATASSVATAITDICRECRTRRATCLKNPSAELRERFAETPLPLPSARMANGIVIYSAGRSEAALLACQESERQATLKGDQAKVACYPAGMTRPHTIFEKNEDQTDHNTFTLLLAIIGILVAGLASNILFIYYRNAESGSARAILKTHPWLEKLTLAGVDTIILLSTFVALSWPVTDDINRWSRLDRNTVVGHSVIIVLTIGWFWLLLEHYTRRRPFWDELREIFRVLAVMFMISGAAAFMVGLETGRNSHMIVWTLNFILIPLGRAGVKQLLDDFGLWKRPAIIIGTSENAHDAYLAIKSERGMGYKLLGFVKVCPGDMVHPETLTIGDETLPILGTSTTVESLFNTLGDPQVIFALDSLNDPENQNLVHRFLTTHRNVHIIPSIRGLPLFGTQLSHFFSHEVLFLTVRNNLSRRGYIWMKRSFDIVLAGLLLILLSPVFVILSYLIRRDGGRALYRHTRVGRNGKLFKCLKFRSMRPNADKALVDLLENDPAARAEWHTNFKLKNDPRITPIGHFLRRTSLDELPQIINVIKGEMSLVGPRPIVADELERYGEHANLFLQVLPGVTGLWQVSGRSDTSYAERVSLDAWYMQNWSLWYDIAILFKTVGAIVERRGAY